jgi:hypothetical protein
MLFAYDETALQTTPQFIYRELGRTLPARQGSSKRNASSPEADIAINMALGNGSR